MTGLIVIGILIVGAIFILAGMYNSLVQLRVRADSAWSDIDIQLKRRHDLIPNLVETVKGYAAHEKGTFENIAKFRSQAMQATTPADKARGGRTAQRRTEKPVCRGGKLSGVEGFRTVHGIAEFTQLH